jgi:glycosyltransferase involved in cell wall biosynthesis
MSVTPPQVTAIVSTYNAERWMRGCLEDLLAQTLAEQLEIIVVDSASTQNERAIVGAFQRQHPRLVYLRTPQRETLYAAWNRAIRLARGRYLTNANTDDRHAPEALATLVRALDRHPQAGVAYASTGTTCTPYGRFGETPVTGQFKARRFDRRRLFWDCLPGPQPMWRRELHDRFGLFDGSLASAGDYEFWLRISDEVRFLHVPQVLGLVYQSPETLSAKDCELSRREAELARDRHWPKAWGPRPADPKPLLRRLSRGDTYRSWARALREKLCLRKSSS